MKWLSVRHFRYPVLSVLIKVNSEEIQKTDIYAYKLFLGYSNKILREEENRHTNIFLLSVRIIPHTYI